MAEYHFARAKASEWYEEQTIPDIEKVVIMSEYFGVTTDYMFLY